MSRFADKEARERFVLGPCACTGTPHVEDWMDLRSQLSGLELASLESAEPIERMKLLILDWNLIGDDGRVAPIDGDYLGRLYLDVFGQLNDWLTEHVKVSTLPNGSGAPSRNGSKASASHIRTTRTRR